MIVVWLFVYSFADMCWDGSRLFSYWCTWVLENKTFPTMYFGF